MDYKQKYLKYKNKYLQLKNLSGGNRCPFEVGDYVIITGPVGDPHLGQNGNITHLHFVNKNIQGQDVRICTGAIINLQGGIRKKSLTTDIRRGDFRVGDYVIITGPVGDPDLGRTGIITYLNFVPKTNISGQVINMCTGAIITFGDGTTKRSPKDWMYYYNNWVNHHKDGNTYQS